MKKITIFLGILLLSFTVKAQEKLDVVPKDYTVVMDSLFRYVNKEQVTTGVLYDRVIANANLVEFNDEKSNKTSSFWHFVQGWSELNRASFNPTIKPAHEIIDKILDKKDNSIDIGIINTKINYVDYGTKEIPNLGFEGGFFRNIADKNPFKEKRVTVIAALQETATSNRVVFRLNPNYIVQDEANKIRTLTMILEGNSFNLISDYQISSENFEYQFSKTDTELLINYKIEYADNQIENLASKMQISYHQPYIPVQDACLMQDDFVSQTGPYQGITANSIENTLPFKGYNETAPSKGVLEYRTYYNHATNTCGNPFKIVKPVIIVDGFDPGDERKLDGLFKLMNYDPDNNPITDNSINLVNKLTDATNGFDVTLVNFPNGADYIERNAMALVALLQRETSKLQANGSTEQITLIGPSMGGLITRYALAYMEKNGIPHNVKLWVSFDSPHLGANIPISTQENLYFFGYYGQKEKAAKKYHDNFGSPAARQMLIEQLDGMHKDYNWWENPNVWVGNNGQNNNSPFRTQFIESLNSNGLLGSKGYPINNIRKIALINGTTNGTKTHNEGQLILELAGFKPNWLKVVAIEDRNLSTFGNWSQTFAGLVTLTSTTNILPSNPFWNPSFISSITFISATINRQNINPRGSMDVVQGGTYNTQGIIKTEFQPELDDAGVSSDWRVYAANHAFIPSVSSLAFKNDDFDWTAPLNRNLVCDTSNKEIEFDSYFSPSKNEGHVGLTKESVAWLLKELKNQPQAPWFDVNPNELNGLNAICVTDTASYSFGNDVCKLPSLVESWSVNSNLEIISSNNFDITVKGITNGEGIITAVFSNGMKVDKKIWIGAPLFNNFSFVSNAIGAVCFMGQYTCTSPQINFNDKIKANFSGLTPAEAMNVDNWEWQTMPNDPLLIAEPYVSNLLCGSRDTRYVSPFGSGNSGLQVKVQNACGWSDWQNFTFSVTTNFDFNKSAQNLFRIFPNPTSDVVNVMLADENKLPVNTSTITAELFDMMQQSKGSVSVLNNTASINVAALPKGIYILKIYIDGTIEYHQVAVQ